HFEPTGPGLFMHEALKVQGALCLVAAVPSVAFLLSERAKTAMQTYRWMLLFIAITGVAMDTVIALLISPYVLVPHISFWGDGILMYIHPRTILYCFAVTLALMYLWLTSILLAFTYRLHKVVEYSRKKQIYYLGLSFCIICSLNIILTCFFSSDTVLLQYPRKEEVERIIREQVPEVMFLFDMPAYIYFVETLSLSQKIMSKRTLIMHRTFIKALVMQMLLPMFLMIVPVLITAISIKFGSKEGAGINHQFISNLSLLFVCSHSPINTAAMYFFVAPFR
ncbi:hypothetical protein PENTCL1PPCAC_20614, partial [Pristionchus entomophagus]